MFVVRRSGLGVAQIFSRRIIGCAKIGIHSRCAAATASAAAPAATKRISGVFSTADEAAGHCRQHQQCHQRKRYSIGGGSGTQDQASLSFCPAEQRAASKCSPDPRLSRGSGSFRLGLPCSKGSRSISRRRLSSSSSISSNASGVQAEKAAAPAAPFPAVSRPVDPAAAKQEADIALMSQAGEWQQACNMLRSIRDDGGTPSMTAHMDVIGVCRRAMEWDEASKTYREMVQAHLPANFFDEMACDDFEDESNNAFQRACGLVVTMEDGDVKPNNATYRALLQFCKDEGSWEAAILLLECSRKTKVKFNLFCFDLLIATVADQGYPDVSTMLYELGVVEADRAALETEDNSTGTSNTGSNKDGQVAIPWPMWPLKVGANGSAILELHDLTLSVALATVRVALLDVVRRPERRAHWSGGKWLRIITGMGNNSKDKEAVIKPAVAEMLESEGLKPEFQQHNEGCIELKPGNLVAYAERIKSQGAAAAPRA